MTYQSMALSDDQTSLPQLPKWVTSARAETPEDVAFLSGAALSHLHPCCGGCFINWFFWIKWGAKRSEMTRKRPFKHHRFSAIIILRGVLSSDHVQIFVSVPPKLVISELVRKMTGRSSYRVQRGFPAIRKRYWGCRFWGRRYFSTANGAITEDAVLQYLEKHISDPNGVGSLALLEKPFQRESDLPDQKQEHTQG